MRPIGELIGRYRSTGLLMDTNVLLLYLIGKFDRSRIERFKRTAQFTAEDFDLLARLLAPFEVLRTLPHVLAEVNSLASQLPEGVLKAFREHFRAEMGRLVEDYVRSADASSRPEFTDVGLTDAAVVYRSLRRYLVLTDDLPLYARLTGLGVDVLNFTAIRMASL